MRTLVIGASGLVGTHLLREARRRGHAALGTRFRHLRPGLFRLDLRDGPAVQELVRGYRPDVVFVAAGCPDAGAEVRPEECLALERDGVAEVAVAVRACWGDLGTRSAERGARNSEPAAPEESGGLPFRAPPSEFSAPRLVFFSGGEVFGDGAGARGEDDAPAPAGARGASKAAAEECLRSIVPDQHIVVRTSMVFGTDEPGEDWASHVLWRLRRGERVLAADDRPVQPTYAPDLAAAALDLVEAGRAGTFHVVGPEKRTEFTFARMLAHVFHLDALLVEPVPAAELYAKKERPGRATLSRLKLREALGGLVLRPTAEALRDWRARLSLAADRPLLLRAA
ncbi:MAG TPA: sugar nucleotide-binding protein [Gemmataceae bacterium]